MFVYILLTTITITKICKTGKVYKKKKKKKTTFMRLFVIIFSLTLQKYTSKVYHPSNLHKHDKNYALERVKTNYIRLL